MWGELLAFLDEEEAVAPSRSGGGRPPYRRAPDRQRQILVRRAIGLGVLLVVLILTALGKSGAGAAVNKIAGYMRYFLASDVLYARAASEINQELSNQGIDQKVPASAFLPEPVTDWLDPLKISSKLAGLSTSKAATSGVHGLALLQSTIGGVQLSPDTTTTISGNGSTLEVSVQNQGDSTEHGIAVSFELTGGTQTI